MTVTTTDVDGNSPQATPPATWATAGHRQWNVVFRQRRLDRQHQQRAWQLCVGRGADRQRRTRTVNLNGTIVIGNTARSARHREPGTLNDLNSR